MVQWLRTEIKACGPRNADADHGVRRTYGINQRLKNAMMDTLATCARRDLSCNRKRDPEGGKGSSMGEEERETETTPNTNNDTHYTGTNAQPIPGLGPH
jgi:hypothetical protein